MSATPQQLRRLTIGISMMCASIILTVVAVMAFVVFMLVMPLVYAQFGDGFESLSGGNMWVVYAIPPLFYTIAILGLLGPPLCLSAPREVGGTSYVLLAIVFSCGSFGWSLASYLFPLPDWPGSVLPILSNFAFLLFALKLAKYLETPEMDRRAKSNWRGIVIALLYGGLLLENMAVVGLMISAGFRPVDDRPMAQFAIMLITLVAMIIGLCLLIIPVVRYISLLFALRSELAKRKTAGSMG